MSTYVLMKILESAPDRYDRGIRLLTFGSVDKWYDQLVTYIKKGQRVLDIGCGTGALTLRAAQTGASVKAIDINSRMMEIARQKIEQSGFSDRVEFQELGIAELDGEPSESYDAVMSGLCFSELSDDELNYGLSQINRILKPGGMLLIADEVRPQNRIKKIIYWLMRMPMVAITYLITQTTTHAVSALPQKVERAGFRIEQIRSNKLGSFMELIAKK